MRRAGRRPPDSLKALVSWPYLVGGRRPAQLSRPGRPLIRGGAPRELLLASGASGSEVGCSPYMVRVARRRSALEGGRQPFEEGVRGGSWQRAAPAEELGSGWPSWRKDLRELLAALVAGYSLRHLDPDRRPGREPAGLLPPARPPRRRPARRRPETAALPAVAAPRTAHPRATQAVAAPSGGLAVDHRRDQHLAGGQDTARTALTPQHIPTIMKGPRPERGTRRTDATVGPRPSPRTERP
jgi:hypothetical protein